VPIFWPVVSGLDFGMPEDDLKMWFGIISLIVVEVGLITPPVGLNVFIINSLAQGTRMKETFIGVMPFLASDMVRVGLLIGFPTLTLWLPHLLK
jgi:TRAP-type C4-dicarboxylate transport system permease large subunit